ncbi:hypothetical protein Pint_20956 [Pistacia integerrima]|uniref:Uncharacterized protein n=1 Tax=Pistacia integerrima TaxID=434235 RepID=A0ACC0XCI6_9ROSI|nr:hypothetical protein Pint_20956 [Pistacia integerrima]
MGNYHDEQNFETRLQLMVPLKCACPNANQSANGVTSLLTYIVGSGETYGRIANYFGVDRQSIQDANEIVSENYIRNVYDSFDSTEKQELCYKSGEILLPLSQWFPRRWKSRGTQLQTSW